MSYLTGTVLMNPTPAQGLVDVIEAGLTAHASWEFVEEVVITTTKYRVWRNKGTGNGFGSDWYLFMQLATAGTGNVTWWCAEVYNAATNQYQRPCPLENTTATAPVAADGSFSTALFNIGTANVHLESLALSTTQFDYFILVAAGHLMINIRVGNTTNGFYVGLFDSLMATDPFPLVIHSFAITSQTTLPLPGTTSRMPDVTGSVARQFATRETTTTGTAWTQAAPIYGGEIALPGSTSGDLYAGGVPLGSRVLLQPLNYTSPGLYGSIRGLFKNLLLFKTPTAVQPGDTIEVGTDTYVLTGAMPSSIIYGIWMNTEAP